MSKFETNSNEEARMIQMVFVIPHLGFEIASDFGFRHSNFEVPS